MSKFADEPMDADTLDRVKALGPDAARVVKAYLRLEGALHRIEDLAGHAIQGGFTAAESRNPSGTRRSA